MPIIHFYFDFVSPYAYVAFHALPRTLAGLPYQVVHRPLVLGALLELSGHMAEAVEIPAEQDLDESWEEPLAFGGCSHEGQAAPGKEQPIHFVRAAQGAAANPGGQP